MKETLENTFHAIAIKDGKLVEMINVYTGEYVKLSFIRKLMLLFK